MFCFPQTIRKPGSFITIALTFACTHLESNFEKPRVPAMAIIAAENMIFQLKKPGTPPRPFTSSMIYVIILLLYISRHPMQRAGILVAMNMIRDGF